jgi:hypothetical protein
MDEDLKKHLEEMETRLREHVSEQCEKVETKLLTEFHKWGSSADARYRQTHAVVGGIDERMLAVEDRVSALERDRKAS